MPLAPLLHSFRGFHLRSDPRALAAAVKTERVRLRTKLDAAARRKSLVTPRRLIPSITTLRSLSHGSQHQTANCQFSP